MSQNSVLLQTISLCTLPFLLFLFHKRHVFTFACIKEVKLNTFYTGVWQASYFHAIHCTPVYEHHALLQLLWKTWCLVCCNENFHERSTYYMHYENFRQIEQEFFELQFFIKYPLLGAGYIFSKIARLNQLLCEMQ